MAGFLVIAGVVAAVDWATPGDNVLQTIGRHPWWTLAAVLAYVPMGCVYSLHRWYTVCLRKRREWDRFAENQLTQEFQLQLDWNSGEKVFEEFRAKRLAMYIPDPWQHKRQLVTLIAYWPISFVWYIGHDFFESIYNRMVQHYVQLRDKAFEGA